MLAALMFFCVSVAFAKPLLHTMCDQPGDEWRNTTVQVVEQFVKQNKTWVTLHYQTMPGCTYACKVIVTDGDVFMEVYDTFLAECGRNGCVYEGRVCYLTSLSYSHPMDEL